MEKRAKGQYYTLGNPFSLAPFRQWAAEADLADSKILEPFAGSNNIIRTLQGASLCNEFTSYDILPAGRDVTFKDTIKSFPKNHHVCVTNPPWLARNSSTRRKLPYPNTVYDDMYKHCLELCLENCEYVAALVPASFLQSGLFRDRLSTYILLHEDGIFNDTENPVCLSLFTKAPGSNSTEVYYDNQFIGRLKDLESRVPTERTNKRVRFNDPSGDLGFISFDNTREPSIRFCEVKEIDSYPIKVSSRFITRISGEFSNVPSLIDRLNEQLAEFRKNTKDLLLTPFKGIRDDGFYRRRMSFALARKLINSV